MVVRNLTKNSLLGDRIRVAEGLGSRLKGLLGVNGLGPGEGLWIRPCSSIHSFGMRFRFDALFLDSSLRVVGRYPSFRRNRLSRLHGRARSVLELPEGTIEASGTEVGDEIQFRP